MKQNNQPVIYITPPEVSINDYHGVVECIKTYDFSNSVLYYKGKRLGTMKSLENHTIIIDRINQTILKVKDFYRNGFIPEHIKNEIINILMGLEG